MSKVLISWVSCNKSDQSDSDEYQDEEEGVVASQTIDLYDGFTQKPEDYNLFIVNTNFWINGYMVEAIWQTKGVESIDVFSPYRMRIGIAPLFVDKEVKEAINELLTTYARYVT